MNLFPISTSNKNAPQDSLLLCEYSQYMSKIINTIFAIDTGRIYSVTDSIDDRPHEINICDAAYQMGYAPITVMEKIVEWSHVAEALRQAREATR